jgi:hypothetical protein
MKKIRSTREGSLITYVGPATLPDGRPADREKVTFWGTLAGDKSGVTDIDEKVLAEAIKDPIVRAWFEEGLLTEHIPRRRAEGDRGRADRAGDRRAEVGRADRRRDEGEPEGQEVAPRR